ncbi:hypothetical protein BIV23_03505 [Streptomyces monashensis]|uniref:ABC transporter domain-containing protein n=1 Tax=Streptomyces monashensis TaxID=1678012 RepID=A0A1S2QPP7_9ACTN|nr:hypothetical protein BIV23_03505 [Streptomyces monashensis]
MPQLLVHLLEFPRAAAEARLGTPAGALSAGQRHRLDLARPLVRPVDLLLLDEPANHLSPLLVEEMERALADYPGTLVVVSHDRRLRSSCRGSRLELHRGRTRTPLAA